MPKIYDADTYKDVSEEQLRDAKWFAEKLGDLIWSPGGTQETFEENVRILRTVYQERQMDAVFMELFARVRKALDGGRAESVADAGITVRMVYTADDFLYTEYPYEEIFSETNLFKRDQIMAQLDKQARAAGVRNFKSLYNQYERSQKDQGNKTHRFGVPRMDSGELQLDPGDWKMDGTGIFKDTLRGREYACSHNIAPVRRLQNIDTGDEKLTLAYERSSKVRYVTRSKRELFDGAKVIDLASVGVAVTSKTAKTLAQYLCEIEGLNYDEIPQQDSVSHLGWLSDGRFSPYVEDLEFDGEAQYGRIYEAIAVPHGKYEKWLECAVKYRKKNIIVQIELAASFASVLVGKLGLLPFFVHVWGGGSGTGKSTAMQLAAAAWGNPEIGVYVQTFNSTNVAFEMTAGFLRNVPLCIDEGQLRMDKFNVYQLSQGAGRGRGRKNGGIKEIPTWALCIMTTGEKQIVSENEGEGAFNRVIDIECKPGEPIFKTLDEFNEVLRVFKQNYGHAGRKFVEQLTEERIEQARQIFNDYQRALLEGETTGKQAMAAAILLTADRLADELLYHTGRWMTVAEISEFLKSRSSVSIGKRGYEYLCDWVALNVSKFAAEGRTDSYGMLDGDYVYINRTVFRKACLEGGFDEKALLSWMKVQGVILTRGRRFTRGKRIAGVNVECVAMRMPDCGVPPEDEDELL